MSLDSKSNCVDMRHVTDVWSKKDYNTYIILKCYLGHLLNRCEDQILKND